MSPPSQNGECCPECGSAECCNPFCPSDITNCCVSLSEECCPQSCDACYPSECCNPCCPSAITHCCRALKQECCSPECCKPCCVCPSDITACCRALELECCSPECCKPCCVCPSDIWACCTIFRHVSTAIFVRILYILFASGVFIYKIVFRNGGAIWIFDWVVLGFAIVILVEMFYTAIWRRGKEWKWFSPSTFALLLAILPSVWEMQLSGSINDLNDDEKKDAIKGMVLAMVFLIMFGKWLAPKGKLTVQEHSLLLIGILACGADITDILDLAEGKNNSLFAIVVLLAFSWSLPQLCFSTTTVKTFPGDDFKNDKPNRGGSADKLSSIPEENGKEGVEDMAIAVEMPLGSDRPYSSIRCNRFCFYNEIWALVLCMLCQDVPFFALRVYAIHANENRDISTIFFAIKNIVTILVTLNRIRCIFKEEYRPWKEQCKELRNQERTGKEYIASENIGFRP